MTKRDPKAIATQMIRCVMERANAPRTAPLALALVAILSFGSSSSFGGSFGAPPPTTSTSPVGAPPAPDLRHSLCPPNTLPDGDACVRLPSDEESGDAVGAPEAESSVNTHRDRAGRWVVYDEIPRRPDRPADYGAYRYPVPCAAHESGLSAEPSCVVSGYDLDRADDQQRRGRRLRQVGHGAVDLAAPRGTPVTSVPLDHQEGEAEVLYVGPLFGNTVVTRNAVREAGRLREYLLIYGHLDSAAAGLSPQSVLREGDVVGFVGDSGSPGLVHLHLEARRLREGVDPSKLAAAALVDGANSVVCDPRNVLLMR
jgi:Peptidase family M23